MIDSLKAFMETDVDGVYYVGHASALVRINKELYLFDPIWNHKPYGEFWDFFPSQVDCDEILSQVKGVIISHIHEDHVCMPILKRLPKGCHIHVMGGRKNLIDRLLNSGALITDYAHSHWHKIADEIEILFVPHAFNSIDSSCFIRSKNYSVYVGSDNFLDARWNESIKHLRPDVAMIPYAFIHWYPRMMDMDESKKISEIKRLNEQSIVQAARTADALKAGHNVPFGNNLVYVDKNSILNKRIATPEDLVPLDPIITGDFVLANGHRWVTVIQEKFPHKDLPELDTNAHIEGHMIEEIRDRVERSDRRVMNHELIVNNIVIDLETAQVFMRYELGEKPCTRFDLDKEVFHDWAIGLITFEQAIGTRRFICKREPDVYNLSVFEYMNNVL